MLKTILEQYRNGERGLPTYGELEAIAGTDNAVAPPEGWNEVFAAIAGGDHDGHARINGARAETQRLDALHYLRMGRENLRLGNRVHNLDFDKAERILAQPTSDAKRAEELRHALFVARDQMRVMANWVKFSDPAAYSWSCNAITIVNAVLERGKPE